MAGRKRGSASEGREPHLTRIPTGVTGLDELLGGGFRRGQLYVLTGAPGTGKTVLSAELAFRHAARGENAVVVSFLSEPHAALVANLASFAFFDPDLIANHKVTFLSASRPLIEDGLGGLLEFIRAAVAQSGATLVAIEGLGALEVVADSPLTSKRFLGDLASLGPMLGCCIVATVARESTDQVTPEQIMADGVFELGREPRGLRRARTFQILKLRGSAHLEGIHSVTIDDAGFCIWPRLESRRRDVERAPVPDDRVGFGIPRLDTMLGGGLVRGSSAGVFGAPGSGKTLLGLHFLQAGCAAREPSLFFGFYESPERLLTKARGVGLRLDRFVKPARGRAKGGLLELLWQPAGEEPIDLLAERLLGAVRSRGIRRLFVDGVDGFDVTATNPARVMRFFAALAAELRALDVTTVFSEETPLFDASDQKERTALSTVYDDILVLRYVELSGQLHRLISILKMRESDYDSSVRELYISPSGIEIAPSPDSAAAILSGRAHPVRGQFTSITPEETGKHVALRRGRGPT